MNLLDIQNGADHKAIGPIKDKSRGSFHDGRLSDRQRSMAYTDINSEDRLVQATFGPAGTLGRRSTASAAALGYS